MDQKSPLVSVGVLALGLIMVFKSWWVGPLELQAHVDFGGSTTIVGLCATASYFAIIFGLPASILARFVVSLPFMFLLFFSTSRTAYVVFLTLWSVFIIRALFSGFPGSKKRFLGQGFLLGMMPLFALLAVTLPLKFSSPLYPFYVPSNVQENIWTYDGQAARMMKVGAKDLIVYRQEELWNRMSRFVRALYSFYQSPIVMDFREWVNEVFDAKLMPDIIIEIDDYELLGGHDPNDRWKRLAYHSSQGESRVQIIRNTNKLIKDRPQGWWPSTYPESIDFYCNQGEKCNYPHNIVLEATFYFGILMGTLYLVLMIFLSWLFLKMAIKGQNYLLTGLSVSILIQFFGAQFTGTYYDLVIAAFLMIVFASLLGNSLETVKDS